MSTIKIKDEYKLQLAPVFLQYPSNASPQSAYVYLDENGDVWGDPDYQSGTMSNDVYHNRTLRFQISPCLTGKDLDSLLKEISPLLQEVHDDHSVEWDGSNMVGRISDEAMDSYNKAKDICQEWEGSLQVRDVGEWLFNSGTLQDHWNKKSFLESIAKIEKEAMEENIYLNGDVGEALAEEALQNLETLTSHQLWELTVSGYIK